MTLDEAMKAKTLFRLEPFSGFKQCGNLTGRYFYETALDKEKEEDVKVEIKCGLFGLGRTWVRLSLLKEVKEI